MRASVVYFLLLFALFLLAAFIYEVLPVVKTKKLLI